MKLRHFILCILASLTLARIASAQSRQQVKTDSVLTLLKKYYNNRQADSIYNLCGTAFRKELSLDAFKGVAYNSLFRMGNITDASLISFLNNKVGRYKISFNYSTLQLLLSLDERDKIEMMLFKPFKEESKIKLKLVPSDNKIHSLMDRQVDSVVRTYIQKENTIGMSIAVIKNGITHSYNYGETARGNGKLPTSNNLFEIGSITKTFTATLLAWYANAGVLKLTDPITKYLPDSVKINHQLQGITLQMLSNHTSGLPRLPDNLAETTKDQLNPYKDYTKANLFSYLRVCSLDNKPGEKYAYSNLAVGLLGVILEKVSGKSFEQLVKEIICIPLGMRSTVQHVGPSLKPQMVSLYNEDGNPTPAWNFNALAACGSLRSSLNDLIVYAKANMQPTNGRLGKAIQLTHRQTFNHDVKVALAWHIISVNGTDYIFHNGGTYGSSSFMAFNSTNKLVVVMLSNCGENTDATGIDLLKKLQMSAGGKKK